MRNVDHYMNHFQHTYYIKNNLLVYLSYVYFRQVSTLISAKEAQGDWTFVYIGENPERWANDTGMHGSNAAAYDHLSAHHNMTRMNHCVKKFRGQSQKQAADLFEDFNDD